jgi:Ca2+-binding RTX toxin-like protein
LTHKESELACKATIIGNGFGDDVIVSGGGDDFNVGDTDVSDGSGDDIIVSGEGNDENYGDANPEFGDGSGNDVIVSGEEGDTNTGNGGRDIFVCGEGEADTVTDYNEEEEGHIATPDCENV